MFKALEFLIHKTLLFNKNRKTHPVPWGAAPCGQHVASVTWRVEFKLRCLHLLPEPMSCPCPSLTGQLHSLSHRSLPELPACPSSIRRQAGRAEATTQGLGREGLGPSVWNATPQLRERVKWASETPASQMPLRKKSGSLEAHPLERAGCRWGVGMAGPPRLPQSPVLCESV